MKSATAISKNGVHENTRRSNYEQDFHAWLLYQVTALKERRFNDLDLENLIEEVEDLARSLPREIRNRLRVVLVHLLKWKFQPSRRSNSRRVTLLEQRTQIQQLLEESPSLRRLVSEFVEKVYESSTRMAGTQMRLDKAQWRRTFPAHCPWTMEQLLDADFLPNGRPSSAQPGG